MILRKLFNKAVPVSEGIKKLGQQMIDNPHEWVQGAYEYVNIIHRDIAIWTCNGISNIKIGGFEGLTLSDKIYLNNCIKISISNRVTTKKPNSQSK